MSPASLFTVQLTGLLAVAGALIYSVGDVLLLAGKASLADYPKLQPYAKQLSGKERIVALPWWRLTLGGLLGVGGLCYAADPGWFLTGLPGSAAGEHHC